MLNREDTLIDDLTDDLEYSNYRKFLEYKTIKDLQIKKLKDALDYYTKNPKYIKEDYGDCDEWYAQKAIETLITVEKLSE